MNVTNVRTYGSTHQERAKTVTHAPPTPKTSRANSTSPKPIVVGESMSVIWPPGATGRIPGLPSAVKKMADKKSGGGGGGGATRIGQFVSKSVRRCCMRPATGSVLTDTYRILSRVHTMQRHTTRVVIQVRTPRLYMHALKKNKKHLFVPRYLSRSPRVQCLYRNDGFLERQRQDYLHTGRIKRVFTMEKSMLGATPHDETPVTATTI